MNFKILRFNEQERTMVIDWGWITLNHHIPEKILSDDTLSEDQVIDLIEKERPPQPEPIEIPPVLKSVYEKSNDQTYFENNDGEDII